MQIKALLSTEHFLTRLPVVGDRHLTAGLQRDVARRIRRHITWPMCLAVRISYVLEINSVIKYASCNSPAANETIRNCHQRSFSIMEVTHLIGWLSTNISFYIRLH